MRLSRVLGWGVFNIHLTPSSVFHYQTLQLYLPVPSVCDQVVKVEQTEAELRQDKTEEILLGKAVFFRAV